MEVNLQDKKKLKNKKKLFLHCYVNIVENLDKMGSFPGKKQFCYVGPLELESQNRKLSQKQSFISVLDLGSFRVKFDQTYRDKPNVLKKAQSIEKENHNFYSMRQV